MALLDFILDHTGAIGARIRSARLKVLAEQAMMQRPPSPKRVSITTSEGKVLVFDATTEISHSFPTKVTSYPVEDRGTVSDHVVNGNPTFSVSGVFSDSSFEKGREHKFNQNETYEQLMSIRDKRNVVSIKTHISDYNDLILTGLSIKRSTGQGRALFVDLTFEKIRRVTNELTKTFVTTSGASKTKVPVTTGDTKTKTTPNVDAANVPNNKVSTAKLPDIELTGAAKVIGQEGVKSIADYLDIPITTLNVLWKK